MDAIIMSKLNQMNTLLNQTNLATSKTIYESTMTDFIPDGPQVTNVSNVLSLVNYYYDGTRCGLYRSTSTAQAVWGANWAAQTFTYSGPAGEWFQSISGYTAVSGTPGSLIIEVRQGGTTGTLLTTLTIPQGVNIGDSGTDITTFGGMPFLLVPNTQYTFLCKNPTGTSTSVCWNIQADTTQAPNTPRLLQSTNNAFVSTNSGSSWSAGSHDLALSMVLTQKPTSGTATKIVPMGDVLYLDNTIFTLIKTAPTNIAFDVLDQNRNVLMSNISSGQSLTSLSRDTYPAILLRATFTKTVYSDPSPTFNSYTLKYYVSAATDDTRLVPYQYLNTNLTTTPTETDIINVTGKGVLREMNGSLGNYQSTFRVYIDGILVWNGRNNPGGSNNIVGIFTRMAYGTLDSPANVKRDLSTFSPTWHPFPYVGSLSSGEVTLINTPIPFLYNLRITGQTVGSVNATANSVFADYALWS